MNLSSYLQDIITYKGQFNFVNNGIIVTGCFEQKDPIIDKFD